MFHPGEAEVQRRAGARVRPGWGSGVVSSAIPGVARSFLLEQRLLALGAADDDGRVWASVLTGEPGFVRAIDDHTILTAVAPGTPDPLGCSFDAERSIGILAIEPSTRRRMRVNGRARREGAGLHIRTEQVYANCPKYIQGRSVAEQLDGPPGSARSSRSLSEEQRVWIRAADTFFVATHAEGLGADVSHRGGHPGFVSVDGNVLTWPDYVGNSMYMTLGNLELDPRAGLVFVDWDRGDTLQMTGRARVDWDEGRKRDFAGAERLIDFEVDEVVQLDHHTTVRWSFEKYSRFNPT